MTTLEPPPVGIDLDDVLQKFNQAFKDVATGFNTAVTKFTAGVNHINGLRWFLGPAMLVVKHDLAAIDAGLKKLQPLVDYALKHQVPVASLIVQSFNWVNNVQTPMSALSYPMTDHSYNEEFAYWEGTAASVFAKKAGQQQAATDAVAKNADFISSWLFTIAKTNVDFMVKLAGTLSAVAGKLTEAALDATTVVNVMFSVDDVAAVVGKIVEDGMNALLEIAKRFVEALGLARDLTSEAGYQNALPNQSWPQAVTPRFLEPKPFG